MRNAFVVFLVSVLALSVSLAGCSKNSDAGPAAGSTSMTNASNPSGSEGSPSFAGTLNQTAPAFVDWTKCTGLKAFGNYVSNTIHSPQDPNWPPANEGLPVNTTDTTRVWMILLDCERLAWGPFERPVRMILEMDDYHGAPQSCFPPPNGKGITFINVLASLWVNDTAVANWLRSTYDGMTVYSSDIQVHYGGLGPLQTMTWTWGTDAQHQSRIDARDDLSMRHPFNDFLYRGLFWNQTRVGAIDLDGTSDFDTPWTSRPTNGTLSAPMIGAEASQTYVDSGDWLSNMNISGKVWLFKDHECTLVEA